MEERHSAIFYPVFSDFTNSDETEIVATLALTISWDSYLSFLAHDGLDHADYILESTCGDVWQFQMKNGQLGPFTWGDDHEDLYENLAAAVPLFYPMEPHYNSSADIQACAYDLYIYPTQRMRDDFKSQTAEVMTAVVTVAFIVVIILFIAQDRYMERKNRQIAKSVEKSNAIIASLFPSNVRDRLFGQNGNDTTSQGSKGSRSRRRSSFGFRLRTYLTEGEDAANDGEDDNPIADLFPACTVVFADIVGFTGAYPPQKQSDHTLSALLSNSNQLQFFSSPLNYQHGAVCASPLRSSPCWRPFTLVRNSNELRTCTDTRLEKNYSRFRSYLHTAFDELAKELGVFKVETIGGVCAFVFACACVCMSDWFFLVYVVFACMCVCVFSSVHVDFAWLVRSSGAFLYLED
jgi:hypothetical protein